MNKVRAVRRIQFCAGHRVRNHESKCKNIHGHNYVVFFHAVAPVLDELGRVIDFSVLKEILGGWIDKYWDHGLILWDKDLSALNAARQVDTFKIFPLSSNPTAENMALFLLEKVSPAELFGTGIIIEKVVLWETENCFVEACLANEDI